MGSDHTQPSTPEVERSILPSSDSLQTQPLASVVDDTGADTIRRYHAQLEYTALWCARLLSPEERLEAVVPEAIEDLMLVRDSGYELHQLKTRDLHLGDWTFSDVVPILAAMYAKGRLLTDKQVTFRFVSNQSSSAHPERGWISGVSLRAFKTLLDVRARGEAWSSRESQQYRRCVDVLVPRLQSLMSDAPAVLQVEAMLSATEIDTHSTLLHYPNHSYQHCPHNVVQLANVLRNQFPGSGDSGLHAVERMCERLLTLIADRIRRGGSIAERRIVAQDIHDCRSQAVVSVPGHPEIDAAPGANRLEKKARLAGFDDPRVDLLRWQMAQAEIARRRLPVELQGEAWDSLRLSLLDCQISTWEAVQRERPGTVQLGTLVLDRIRPRLLPIAQEYLPGRSDINDAVCQGVLWKETALCRAYWHGKSGGTP